MAGFRILLVMVALLLAACDLKPPAPPTVLGSNLWPGYEPLYLARDLKRWSGDEIHLVEYPSASEVIRAFRNGSLDVAALTMDEVLLLLQNEIPVKVFLVADISAGADVVMAWPEIGSFAEMKGRRIGVESSALGAYVLSRALEINGMSLDDVEVRNLPLAGHEDAYLRHEVDAVVTFDPVRTRLKNRGAHELFSSTQVPGEIVDVLVVHARYLEQHPERIRKLVDGWFAAQEFMVKERAQAMAMIGKRLSLTAAEVEASYQGLVLPGRSDNKVMLGGAEPQMAAQFERLADVMIAKGLLRKRADTKALLTDGSL